MRAVSKTLRTNTGICGLHKGQPGRLRAKSPKVAKTQVSSLNRVTSSRELCPAASGQRTTKKSSRFKRTEVRLRDRPHCRLARARQQREAEPRALFLHDALSRADQSRAAASDECSSRSCHSHVSLVPLTRCSSILVALGSACKSTCACRGCSRPILFSC